MSSNDHNYVMSPETADHNYVMSPETAEAVGGLLNVCGDTNEV